MKDTCVDLIHEIAGTWDSTKLLN